jgi:uncharacterized phage infection (PIP) family protein YhgE
VEYLTFKHLEHRFDKLEAALTYLKDMMTMNHAELISALGTIGSQLVKANGEIQTKIQALTDAVNAAGDTVPQDVADAVTALQTAAQALDDIVPDAP